MNTARPDLNLDTRISLRAVRGRWWRDHVRRLSSQSAKLLLSWPRQSLLAVSYSANLIEGGIVWTK